MIVRRSQRSLQYRPLKPVFEQVRLPWLCPALCESHPRKTIVTVAGKTIPSTVTKSTRQPIGGQKLPSGRAFAYAATAGDRFPQEEYIPFDSSASSIPPSNSDLIWPPPPRLSDIPIFDPRQPLILEDFSKHSRVRFRSHLDGVGGSLVDIHQTLHACLRIGRLDRASTCLRTLGSIYKSDRPELIEAHNQYLEHLVRQVDRTRDQGTLKQAQRWFEVEMRGKDIHADGWTYALMIQASFRESNQKKIDRTVRRYIALAKEAEVWEDALEELEVSLTDREIARATEV